MKKYLLMLLAGVGLFLSACEDPELDPLQFDKIVKGSMIALRGDALDNLGDRSFLGAIDKFSKAANPANETFTFDADFLADDLNGLDKVEIYARATDGGTRALVTTVPGSAFAVPTDATYPRASFSMTYADILSALKIGTGDLTSGSYLYVECDLKLKDGRTILASSIVNSSLFESAHFYPAHRLLALVTD
jgi:hypothetical protein